MEYRRKNLSGPAGRVMRLVFLACGVLVLAMVAVISICLFAEGITMFQRIGIAEFIFGTVWAPGAATPQYGIWPLALTSIYVLGASMVVSVPLGIITSLFLARYAPPRLKKLLGGVIVLACDVPSVLYGLLGVVFVLPGIATVFSTAYGEGLLAVIIVISMMFVPRVASMTMLNFALVPREVELAALALGATESEVWYRVSLRHVRGDLLVSVLMQTGVIAGETLAIMMVAGNVANMPRLLGSVQTLTTAIANEAYSTGSTGWHVLFSIALLLCIFGMLLFTVIRIVNRIKRGGKG